MKNNVKSIQVYLHAQASVLVEIYFLRIIVYRYDIVDVKVVIVSNVFVL